MTLVELMLPGCSVTDSLFFLLNSYTTGLSPSVMEYMLGVVVRDSIWRTGLVR